MKIGKNKHILKRSVLFMLALCIGASSLVMHTTANAASFSDLTVQDQARAYAYYQATLDCIISGNMNDGIVADTDYDGTHTDPANGNWFPTNKESYIPTATGSGINSVACNTIVHTTLNTYFGYADNTYYKLLQSMGYKWHSIVANQWVNTNNDSQKLTDFKKTVTTPTFSAASKYWLYQNAFFSQCSPTPVQGTGSLGDPVSAYSKTNTDIIAKTIDPTGQSTAGQSKVKVVNNGILDTYGFKYKNPTADDLKLGSRVGGAIAPILLFGNRDTTATPASVGVTMYCDELVDGMNANASAYATAIANYTCKQGGYTTGDPQKACVAGFQHSTDKAYCQTTYSTNAALLAACIYGSGIKIDDDVTASTVTGGDGTSQSSCSITGIGWIVCPVVNFLAGLADGAFGFLADNFLNTSTSLVDPAGTTHKAWSAMRDIANVAFVIVFLIIIFSQLTSFGVSNYGVKKMLPRLVIAAILVNLSFIVCQIAVDLSNILGFSLKDLFTSFGARATGATAGTTNISPFADGSGFVGVAGGVLGFTAVGVGIYALLGTFIPVLIAAVLALVMILFLLVARQALIVLLIVISPLAFVAYLLPNTEQWFKKWRQALTAMLLLFPIIAVVFGASSLAATILATTFNGGITGDTKNWFGQIAAAGVMILPLFAVPVLLKKSLDGIPAVGKFMGGMTNRATGNLKSKTSESYRNSLAGRGAATRKQARQNFRDKRFASRLTRDPNGNRINGAVTGVNNLIAGGVPGLLGRVIPANSRLGSTPLGILAAQNESINRAAQGTAATAQSDEVKQESVRIAQTVGTTPYALRDHIIRNSATMSDTEIEAASDLLLASAGVDQYREILSKPEITSRHMRSLVSSGRRNEGAIRPKAADIANSLGVGDVVEKYSATGFDGTQIDPSTGKSAIENAYSNAEAAKLVTMSPETAKIAEQYIRIDQAQIALDSQHLADIKPGTQDVLKRKAGRP